MPMDALGLIDLKPQVSVIAIGVQSGGVDHTISRPRTLMILISVLVGEDEKVRLHIRSSPVIPSPISASKNGRSDLAQSGREV